MVLIYLLIAAALKIYGQVCGETVKRCHCLILANVATVELINTSWYQLAPVSNYVKNE